MLQAQLISLLKNAIERLVQEGKLTLKDPVVPKIELPRQKEHGDYATNLALVLSKIAAKAPMELASDLTKALKQVDEGDLLLKAEAAKPGFINLTLNPQTLFEQVTGQVLQKGSGFGRQTPLEPKRILVEFVSANPTGPLHLGHARGAFVGDAICRLLKACGHEVEREFYVNDVGNQVSILAKSIYARYQELFGISIELAKDGYPGEYIIEIAKRIQQTDGDQWLEKSPQEWLPYFQKRGVEENLNQIQKTLKKSGIEFDQWYSEEKLYEKGLVNALIQKYDQLQMTYEAEQALGAEEKIRREESKASLYKNLQAGGLFLKTSLFGDTEDRILVRHNGQPAYMAGDLAYHYDKYNRHFDRLINVFGADHAGHVPRLRAGLRALGLPDEKLEFVLVQMVRMIRQGKPARFSKRLGQVDLLEDLLEDIGNDVARFGFLMRSSDTQFDFDIDEALRKSSESPVFYVQYGHARLVTLLKKAQLNGITPQVTALGHVELLDLEKEMLKKVDLFPELLYKAAWDLEPHRLIYYCQDLVGDFHRYFTQYRHTHKIISEDLHTTQVRILFVYCVQQVICNALTLLGISAPEEMYMEEEA